MYTPEGFEPAYATPAMLPDTALAFAFSDDKMLVGGTEAAPIVPTLGELQRAGVDGVRHFLGELSSVPCVAVGLKSPLVVPDGFRLAGLRLLFFRISEPLLALGARAFQII